MAIELCNHGMNPRSCPSCWQAQAAAPQPKKVATNAVPFPTTNNVMPLGEAVMRSTQGAEARARIAAQQAKMNETQKQQGSVRIEDEPESFNKDGLWEPKGRKQLIESLPRHPHAQEGSATRLR
jgi:hypothetical protein